MDTFEITLLNLLAEANSYRKIIGLPTINIVDIGSSKNTKETILLVKNNTKLSN